MTKLTDDQILRGTIVSLRGYADIKEASASGTPPEQWQVDQYRDGAVAWLREALARFDDQSCESVPREGLLP